MKSDSLFIRSVIKSLFWTSLKIDLKSNSILNKENSIIGETSLHSFPAFYNSDDNVYDEWASAS